MQKIQKTIHLEDFKTRYPIIYPSLRNNTHSLVNYSSLRLFNNANYATIPYGVNEAVCGAYSGYTEEMGNFYLNKTIDYKTLEDWYKQFRDYFVLLYNNPCGVRYSSATQYYYANVNDRPQYSDYRQMDVNYKKHGGELFYKWLCDYCFLALDLLYEYRLMESEHYTINLPYVQWQDIVIEIGADVLYYPAVIKLYSKMKLLQTKYSGDTNCIESENCCDCVDYKNLGGDDTVNLLEHWIKRNGIINLSADDELVYYQNWIYYLNRDISSPNTTINAIKKWMHNAIFSDMDNPLWKKWMKKSGHKTKTVNSGEELEWLKLWKEEIHPEIDITENMLYFAFLFDDLTPKPTLKISFKRKVADFGNYTIFSKEYNSATDYESGSVCTYNGVYYILTGGTGHSTDTATQRQAFNQNNWIPYFTFYKNLHVDEFKDYSTDYSLNGRTQSSLQSFEREERTVDNMGNILPGYYRAESGSTFIQPAEGTYLDLNYEIGQVVNMTYLAENHFAGDVLYQIVLFYKSKDGITIPETVTTVSQGDDFLNKVALCKQAYVEHGDDSDLTIYADFVYYKGTMFSYNQTNGTLILDTEIISGVKYTSGIKYTDHCYIELKTWPYYLSSTECYPIKYYNIVMDEVEMYSDSQGETKNVYMADFSLYPIAYQKSTNTENGWANMLAAPLLRKEETLGITIPEKVTDNIYIDRGYATVMDRILKMGEITSYEALEKYGNGSFNLINSAEETL